MHLPGRSHGAPVPLPYIAPAGNGKPSTYLIFKMTILPFDISDYVGNDNVSEWTFEQPTKVPGQ
jgi:hypothetical protein